MMPLSSRQHRWPRHSQSKGKRGTFTRVGDPHSLNHICWLLSALPNGNSPVGSTPLVGVLDRSPALPTSPSSAPAPASTPLPPAAPAPDRTTGYLALSLVPLLWGTYNPCIRYLYAEADPLDPASLTAVRTLLSAGALLLPALVGFLAKSVGATWLRNHTGVAHGSTDVTDATASAATMSYQRPLGAATLAATADGAADGVAAAAAGDDEVAAEVVRTVAPSQRLHSLFAPPLNNARLGPVITCTFQSVVLGGLELGLLNFLGTALQVEGLHSTSATRAGFLAEVTAVLTPLVSYLAGYEIPRQMWLAVAVGLVGSTMVAYDTSQDPIGFGAAIPAASRPQATAPASVFVADVATPDAQGVPPLVADTIMADADISLARWSTQPAEAATTAAAAFAPITGLPDAVATSIAADAAVEVAPSSAALAAMDGSTLAVAVAADALTSTATSFADAAVDAAPLVSTAANAAGAGAGIALQDAAITVLQAVGPASGTAAAAAVATVTATAAQLAITGGEAYLLLACLFYSICTVRMGIYAPRMDTVGLAAMKKVGLSSMSVLWMAATNLQNGAAPGAVLSFPDLSDRTPMSIAVLMYSGLGPGALATYLQVTGLSTVPATTAQVIYSMTPLCTAFFAYLILGGEATGPVAWVGGSLIIGAALMAADAQQKQHRQQQQQQ